tara:strand:- start:78 stop:518 length:441 start_codon:yes stop_codon:yes gene_type:complete
LFATNDILGNRILSSSSVLVGFKITSMSAFLKRTTGGEGIVTFAVFNADSSIAHTFSTLDIDTIALTSTQYTSATTAAYTLSNGQTVGVQYGGNGGSDFRMMSGYSSGTTPTAFNDGYQSWSKWNESNSAWEDTDNNLAMGGYLYS